MPTKSSTVPIIYIRKAPTAIANDDTFKVSTPCHHEEDRIKTETNATNMEGIKSKPSKRGMAQ